MGGVIINSQGDEIMTETAKETGRYYDGAGVPRQVAAGDPIPPGFVHEDKFKGTPGNESADLNESGEKVTGKAKTKPAANKAKDAPAESK
jgi:hypothetical protein